MRHRGKQDADFTAGRALTPTLLPVPKAALERRYTPTGSSDNSNTCSPLELVWFRSGWEPQGPSLGLMGVSRASSPSASVAAALAVTQCPAAHASLLYDSRYLLTTYRILCTKKS